MNNFEKGTIIKGHSWPEPVELKLVENAGDYVDLIGVTTISYDQIDRAGPNDGYTTRMRCPLLFF